MENGILDTWKMACEANIFLLDWLPKDHLDDKYSARTRTVRAQFVHIHNVRHRWLTASAPKLAKELNKFEKGAEPAKKEIIKSLKESEKVMAKYLAECKETGKVKNWNGPIESFLGYLIAHEAHHRGLAMVAMRISGHKVPQEIVYGQWDWGKARSAS